MWIVLFWIIFTFYFSLSTCQDFVNVPLKSTIDQVNPMIGLVFYDSHIVIPSNVYSMEFSYVLPDQLITGRIDGILQYNWTYLEDKLNAIASRGHQAILRFRYESPGLPTAVPAFLKSTPGYQGQVYNGVEFMDWRSMDLMQMHFDMYTAVAQNYDNDNRIFCIQTGFGFWSEYHIFGGPQLQLGYNFPSADFQVKSIQQILSVFKTMPIQYGINLADTSGYDPLFNNISNLPYGAFSDSSFSKEYDVYNNQLKSAVGWKTTRYQNQPLGGEIAYVDNVQKHALDLNGPEGQSLPDYVAEWKYTWLLADSQTNYKYDGNLTQVERIKQIGMTFGYKFTITSFQTNGTHTQVTVQNNGVAPPYKDMFIQVSGVQSPTSLKYLQPEASVTIIVQVNALSPTLNIVSPFITSNQTIQFEANL